MRIDQSQGGYSRGRWQTIHDTGLDRAVPVEITPDHVTIGGTGRGYRVTLTRREVESIYRLTFGIDWQKPEQEDNQP